MLKTIGKQALKVVAGETGVLDNHGGSGVLDNHGGSVEARLEGEESGDRKMK